MYEIFLVEMEEERFEIVTSKPQHNILTIMLQRTKANKLCILLSARKLKLRSLGIKTTRPIHQFFFLDSFLQPFNSIRSGPLHMLRVYLHRVHYNFKNLAQIKIQNFLNYLFLRKRVPIFFFSLIRFQTFFQLRAPFYIEKNLNIT